jgi:hypothetical protein
LFGNKALTISAIIDNLPKMKKLKQLTITDLDNEEKQKLIRAEERSKELFNAVEEKGLIVPGKSEAGCGAR